MRNVVIGAWLIAVLPAGCTKSGPQVGAPASKAASPSDAYGKQAEVVLAALEKLAGDLSKVESAEAAAKEAPQLERQVDDLRRSIEKLSGLEKPGEEDFKQRKAAIAERARAVAERYNAEMRRIRQKTDLKPLREVATRMLTTRGKLRGTVVEFPSSASSSSASMPPGAFMGPPPGFGPPVGFGPPPGYPVPPGAFPGGMPPGMGGVPMGAAPDAANSVVMLEVAKVDALQLDRLANAIRQVNEFRPFQMNFAGGIATFQLLGVSDFDALDGRLQFGQVIEVNKKSRRIKIELDPDLLP